MLTQSSSTTVAEEPMLFDDLGSRRVVTDFTGGHISSNGGALLLGQLDRSLGMSGKLAGCFTDARLQLFVEHSVKDLVSQRLLGLATGYEDLNDHNALRVDPLFATAVGKVDPLGSDRLHAQDRGKALAGASTLNRLELGNDKVSCYHKISADHEKIADLLIFMGVQTLSPKSREVVLDLDATNNPLYGQQEGYYFHGFYREYCYLPLHIFIGSVPVWAQLQTSDHGASKGSLEALKKLIPAIRKRCPKARIMVRGDSGFCREEIMSYCESQQPVVFYCFGLQKNPVLVRKLAKEMAWARAMACLTGGQGRRFDEFEHRTCKKRSWSRSRRVIGKAEVVNGGDNPRFIVTNLPADGFEEDQVGRFGAARCYEEFYCARGDMENRIKESQLDLFSDRTSTHYLKSNQLRIWFSAFAHLLMERLRTVGLKGTQLARATAGTIRARLLKVGALLTVSTRRIYVRLASAFPLQEIFRKAQRALAAFSP